MEYIPNRREKYLKERTVERSKKFINLRANGLSLTKIAEELGVCRQTLSKWDKDLEEFVGEIKYVELEELKTQYQMEVTARIKNLGIHLEKLRKELEKRDLSDLSTEKLSNIYLTYFDKFMDEIGKLEFKSKENQQLYEYMEDNSPYLIPRYLWNLSE